MLDLSLAAFILGIVGTATGVVGLILRLIEKRKERAELSAHSDWGYYLERGTGDERRASVHVNVFVDNRGRRSSTVKRIVGTVPAEGGGEMIAEGRLSEGDRKIPLPIDADASELLELTFDFVAGPPRFMQDYATPAGLSMGATGHHLPIAITVYHTYGQVETRFAAYPRDSFETWVTRHLSLSLAKEGKK